MCPYPRESGEPRNRAPPIDFSRRELQQQCPLSFPFLKQVSRCRKKFESAVRIIDGFACPLSTAWSEMYDQGARC